MQVKRALSPHPTKHTHTSTPQRHFRIDVYFIQRKEMMLQLSCNWFPAGRDSHVTSYSLSPFLPSPFLSISSSYSSFFLFTLSPLPLPTLPFSLHPLSFLTYSGSAMVRNYNFLHVPTESWSPGACECSLKCCLHFLCGSVCAAARKRRHRSFFFFFFLFYSRWGWKLRLCWNILAWGGDLFCLGLCHSLNRISSRTSGGCLTSRLLIWSSWTL